MGKELELGELAAAKLALPSRARRRRRRYTRLWSRVVCHICRGWKAKNCALCSFRSAREGIRGRRTPEQLLLQKNPDGLGDDRRLASKVCPRSISATRFPTPRGLARHPAAGKSTRMAFRPMRSLALREPDSGSPALGYRSGRISFSPSSQWRADSCVPFIFSTEPSCCAQRADGRVNIFIRRQALMTMRLTSALAWLNLLGCRHFPTRKQIREILAIPFPEPAVYFRWSPRTRAPQPPGERLPAQHRGFPVRGGAQPRVCPDQPRRCRAWGCRLQAAMV